MRKIACLKNDLLHQSESALVLILFHDRTKTCQEKVNQEGPKKKKKENIIFCFSQGPSKCEDKGAIGTNA